MMYLAIAAFAAAYLTIVLSIKRHSERLDRIAIGFFCCGLALLIVTILLSMIEVIK